MTDPAQVAWRIVVDAAREAYTERLQREGDRIAEEVSESMPEGVSIRFEMEDAIPIDTRCPGCGLYLDGCESGLCSQRHDEEE